MRGALAIASGALVVVMPSIAAACPACAGSGDPGIGKQVAIGLMVVSPYFVVGTVLFFLIRRLRPSENVEGQR